MRHYLAAMRSHHVARRWDVTPFESLTLLRIVNGAARLYAKPKTARLTITMDILRRITAAPAKSKLELNLRACYLVAFAGFMRMGELTYTERETLDGKEFFRTKITRSCVRFSANYDHATILLKRSKTDVDHEGVTILLAATFNSTCPVQALRDLFSGDPRRSDDPLFNWNGSAFTKSRLQAALNKALLTHGIDPASYRLHSFRKGAAQHAVDSGMREDQVMALGGWSSQAFRVYFTHRRQHCTQTVFSSRQGNRSPLVLYNTNTCSPHTVSLGAHFILFWLFWC